MFCRFASATTLGSNNIHGSGEIGRRDYIHGSVTALWGANPHLPLAAGFFLVHGLAATPRKIFPKNKKANEMKPLHDVKIYHEKGRVIPTHVEVDGESMPCKGVVFSQSNGSIPTVLLQLNSLVEIDSPDTEVYLHFHPTDVKDAITLLRSELMRDKGLYSGFLSSIESSLKENLDRTDIHGFAADVLDRIIGFDTEVTE